MINKDEIKKLAKICKLKYSETEMDSFLTEFEKLLSLCGNLNIECENLATFEREILFASLREDEVTPSLTNQETLSNTEGVGGYFTVGRVIK